jgi:hypothetical protein
VYPKSGLRRVRRPVDPELALQTFFRKLDEYILSNFRLANISGLNVVSLSNVFSPHQASTLSLSFSLNLNARFDIPFKEPVLLKVPAIVRTLLFSAKQPYTFCMPLTSEPNVSFSARLDLRDLFFFVG